MVSTRGVKFNFTEGERVLCYEPDPTKAKVLYDSKILACNMGRDPGTGKKLPEYLVHFSGWNSSWDRIVAEDLILKDVPESRLLQRQLAEAAAKHLKGKKGLKLNKIPTVIKDALLPDDQTSEAGSDTVSYTTGDNLLRDHMNGGKRLRAKNMGTSTGYGGGDGTSTGTSSEDDETSTLAHVLDNQEDEPEEGDGLAGHHTHYWRIPKDLKNLLTEDSKRFSPQNGTPCKLYVIPENANSQQEHDSEHDQEFHSVDDIVTAYSLSSFPTHFMHDKLAPVNPAGTETNSVEGSNATAMGGQSSSTVASGSTGTGSTSSSNTANSTLQNTWTTVRNHELLKEFKSSMLIYFDALLVNEYLFYVDAERRQWEAIQRRSGGSLRPCAAYGMMHLLRALVIMPDFLAATPAMGTTQKRILIKFIQNFISFLNTNWDSLIPSSVLSTLLGSHAHSSQTADDSEDSSRD